jgi:tetratricopeptide (TPR) repeat protein
MDFCPNTNNMTIDLNNKAIELIDVGHYKQAISLLRKALQSSKQIISEAAETELPFQMTLDQCMAQSPYVCQDEKEQQLFMYKRPIYIHGQKTMAFNYKASVLTSVVVLFNLSLAFQLFGTKDANARHLKKAAKLYELTFKMTREEDFESMILFSLACTNNVALVYHELKEMSTSLKYFESLLSTLMFLVECGKQNAHELDGFFRNTFFLIVSKTSAAAVA